MKKYIIGVIAILIVSTSWFLVSGKYSSMESSGYHKKLIIDGETCIVAAFDIQPVWRFNTRIEKRPTTKERWRKLVLLGQSDFIKFLGNKESKNMYGRAVVSDEQINSQRSYVIERFEELDLELEIRKIYIVLDPQAKLAHLLVSVAGPQGEYFTSLEWINSEWYLVPGTGETSWPILNAKKIIQAVGSQKLEFAPIDKLDNVIQKLSATYL